MDDEIVSDLCGAVVMCVATQNHVFAAGVLLGGFAECLSNLAADEERGPVVVGRFAFVPARFAKRWDVCGDQDLHDFVGQIVQLVRQTFCGGFAFRHQQRLPAIGVAGAKVFDQLEVIQANVRAGVVTLCRIAPSVVADQNR